MPKRKDQPSLFGDEAPTQGSATAGARGSDPQTSHEAARAAVIGFNRHVFRTLWLYAGYGEIDEDAWKRSAEFEDGQWAQGTTSKRRHRAMEAGLIEECKELTGRTLTRATSSGQQALVWRLTEKGRTTYARWLKESGDPRAASR